MRYFFVALVMLGVTALAWGAPPKTPYQKQMAKQRGRAEAAAKSRERKAKEAAKIEARRRANDPEYAAAQEKKEKEQAELAGRVFGAFIGAMAASGGGGGGGGDSGGFQTNEAQAEAIRQQRSQYYQDRAAQDAAAGRMDDARRNLEFAK